MSASEVAEPSVADETVTLAADGTSTVAPSDDGRSVAEESVAVSTIAMAGSRVVTPDEEEEEEEEEDVDEDEDEPEVQEDQDDDDDEQADKPRPTPEESPEADAAVIAEAEAAEAVEAAADGSGGADSPAPVPLEAPKLKKKSIFVAKASPKCALCGKSVYKTEEVLDSTDRIFHKKCLRCATCKASLVGRQPITDESVLALSKSQFRPTDDGLFCDKHAQRTRGTLVQGTLGRDAAELRLQEKQVLRDPALQEKTKTIKQEMEVMVGDAAPVCARCGNSLEGHGAVIVSGLERFHQKCPDAPEDVPRTVRYFVKKAEERPVLQVRCDARADAKPVSFLMDLDPDSKRAALLQTKAALAELVYAPDAETRSGLTRKLPAGHEAAEKAFSLELRHDKARLLSDVDPAGWSHAPSPDFALRGAATQLPSETAGGKKAPKKPQAVFLALSLQPDPVLSAYATQEDMNQARKPLSRLLLGRDSRVARVPREEADGPGFSVSGVALSSGKAGEERAAEAESSQLFRTEGWWQAHAWAHALEDAVAKTAAGALDDEGEQTVVFRLFAVRGGVLQQHVIAFAYRSGRNGGELELRDKAYAFFSEYPEKSAAEQQKADPLAALKETKKEKAAEAAEEERRVQIADAQAAKKEQAKSGGGCCVVM